jgi:hypothetical protein
VNNKLSLGVQKRDSSLEVLPELAMRAVFPQAGVGFVLSNPHCEYTRNKLKLKLKLIQTQMAQKPMLRAEGECACVAQTASNENTHIHSRLSGSPPPLLLGPSLLMLSP